MRSYCPCSLDCFCGDKRYVTAADSHPGREGGRKGGKAHTGTAEGRRQKRTGHGERESEEGTIKRGLYELCNEHIKASSNGLIFILHTSVPTGTIFTLDDSAPHDALTCSINNCCQHRKQPVLYCM